MKDHCPNCGGLKCKRSKQCQDCYLEFLRSPESYLKTPETRKMRSKLSKGRKHSEETRRKLSEIKKAQWKEGIYSNPETRKKHINQIRRNAVNPKLRAQHSKAMKRAWACGIYDGQHDSPQYRQRHLEGIHTYWKHKAPTYEPYGSEFNDELKEIIREKNDYKCQICGLPGHDVHHIDYNKKNNALSNLVYLCKSCHSKTTHGNREYWQAYLTGQGYELMIGAC